MKKILAIDDQLDNLITIKAVIKSNIPDALVFTAHSGDEGIEMARKEQPDVILLDIIMPQMDGYQTCEFLKNDELIKHIPVIMLTAIKTDSKSRVKGLDMGADAFLAKPIDAVELVAQVKVMLRIKAAEDQLRKEKSRIEEKFKISDSKYKHLVETATDAIYLMDKNAQVIDVNQAACLMLDKTRDELIGQPMSNVDPSVSGDAFFSFWEDKSFEDVQILETYHLNKKGKKISVEVSCKKFKIDDDIFYYGIARNITERKKVLDALENSEKSHRLLFENASMGIGYFSLQGELIRFNNAAAQFMNGKPSDFVGMSIVEMYGKENGAIYLQRLHKAASSSQELVFEDFVTMPSGDKWFYSKYNRIQDRTGNVIGIQIISDDITERKKAEDLIKESQERYDLSVNATKDGIYDWNLLTNEIYYTPSYKSMLGYRDDEIPNDFSVWESLTDPDDAKASWKMLSEVMNKERDRFEIEFKMKHKNGHWVDILSRASVYFNELGKAVRVVGTHVDISEQKKTNLALKESEAFKQTLIETIPDLVWIKDINGVYINCNLRFESLYGAPNESIIGKTDYDFVDKDQADFFRKKDKDAIAAGKSEVFEEVLTFANDGHIEILETIKTPMYNQEGIPYAVLGVGRNITARKQSELALKESEEKYRSLMNNLPVGVFRSTYEGKVISSNLAMAQIYGYDSVDELINLPAQDYYSEENPRAEMLSKLKETGYLLNFETLELKKDGSKIWVSTNYRAIFNEINEITFIEGVIIDITESKKSKDRLRESEMKYRSLFENMMDAFAYHKIVVNEQGEPIDYVFLEVNKAFENLTGLQGKDIIGKRVTEVIPGTENDSAGWIDIYGKVALLGENCRFEDYSEPLQKWFSVNAYSPKLGYFATNFEDITQRKENEAKINLMTKRLQLSTQSAQIGIWDLNLKNNQLIWDEQMFEFYGIEPNDFYLPYQIWKDGIHPDDLEQALKDVQDAINGKKEFHTQFRIIRPNGEIRFIEAHAMVLHDDEGVPENMIGVNWDITERKMAENELIKLSKAVEQSPVSIVITDLQGNVEYANARCFEVTGYSKEELLGNNPRIFKSGNKNLDEYEELWNTLLSGKEWRGEFLNKKKNKELFWEHASISPIKNDKGDITHFLAVKEDITDRKVTEEALRNSERRFEAFMNNIPAGIFIKDKNGKYLFSNKYNEEVHNLTQWEGKTVYDFFPKETADKFSDDDKKVLNGEFLMVEGNVINKNGEPFYFKNHQFSIDQKDGTKLIGGISLDVTKEKEAEKELKESEEKYRIIIETSNDLIWTLDRNGNFTFINKRAEDTIGYLLKDWYGKSFAPMVMQDELPFLTEVFVRTMNKESVNYEMKLKGKKDKILTLSVNTAPIYSNNEVSGVISFASDITEKKRQDQIRQIIFNISNAVISSDNLHQLVLFIQKELGSIIDTTNFYLALYNPVEDTISLPFFSDEFDQMTSLPAEKTITRYVITTKKSLLADTEKIHELENANLIGRFGTDSLIWLGVPLKVDNEIIGVIAVQSYRDSHAYNESDKDMLEFISDQISIVIHRKKAEDDLKLALRKAEESDRLKSAFLANMSHEIRTPMNGIMGFANLLYEPDLSKEEQDQYIRVINRSGERLLSIINDLIDISKIESGQMEAHYTEGDLNEQIQFLYSFFKPEVENKGMTFSVHPPIGDEKMMILTDKEKLYAILTNLIKNAVKYSREGSIEFGYEIKQDKMSDFIEFHVKDTGMGISKNKLQDIFDRFIQADIEDSKVYEGAGLGLAISKAYVELLGGSIWVESEINIGSTFYFTLPLNSKI